jgi:hypothetical protein
MSKLSPSSYPENHDLSVHRTIGHKAPVQIRKAEPILSANV